MKLKTYIKSKLKPIVLNYYIRRFKKCIKKRKALQGQYSLLKKIAEYSINDFKLIKKYNDEFNAEECQKKSVIKFAFVVYTSSMWNVDELYRLLSNNACFNVDIIVAHFSGLDIISSNIEFDKTVNYFISLGYHVKKANEISEIDYDILFYLTPFYFFDKEINLDNIPLKTLVLHTSYSYMLTDNMAKTNLWMYHFSYRYYTDSDYYRRLIEQSVYYTGNAKYLGFPKIDQYYSTSPDRQEKKKIIIYAPHHSVNYIKFKSATFEDNYREILELAKKYSDTIYWIYKPHPVLRSNSVKGGVFSDVEQYDKYEKEWNDLPNAEVMTCGDYFAAFSNSDAMITDSVSFLAEYQFTHKPLLLLESGQEEYNDFGKSIVEILYKCAGKDIEGIDQFINDVINDHDVMYDKRKRFFEENLDYIKDGKTANYKIYQDILEFIKKTG